MRLALFLLAGIWLSVATAWTEGEICSPQRISNITSSGELLRGQHLLISSLEWSPYATQDLTKTGNEAWTGFDIDLLEYVAGDLGFTYTLVPFVKTANETWAAALIRTASTVDLILSYWLQNAKRRSQLTMLSGHVDGSYALLALKPTTVSPSFLERMYTVLSPFTVDLWVSIIVMTGIGACVMVRLETASAPLKASSSRVAMCFKSWYLICIQPLNGGREHNPKTRLGKLYFLILGMAILVIVSSYTVSSPSHLQYCTKIGG